MEAGLRTNVRTRTTQVWADSAPSGVVRFLVVFTSNLQSSQRGPLFGESSPERGNDCDGSSTSCRRGGPQRRQWHERSCVRYIIITMAFIYIGEYGRPACRAGHRAVLVPVLAGRNWILFRGPIPFLSGFNWLADWLLDHWPTHPNTPLQHTQAGNSPDSSYSPAGTPVSFSA